MGRGRLGWWDGETESGRGGVKNWQGPGVGRGGEGGEGGWTKRSRMGRRNRQGGNGEETGVGAIRKGRWRNNLKG